MKQLLTVTALMALLAGAQAQSGNQFIKLAEDCKKRSLSDSALFYYEKAADEFQISQSTEAYANACNQAGALLTRQDEYEKARTWLMKALTAGLSRPDSNNLTVASTYITLGVIYAAEEKYEQSLVFHNRALNIRLQKLGELHADVATSHGNIGNVQLRAKNYDKAVEAHLKAMQIREKLFGSTGTEINQSYMGLGNAYREKKVYPTSLDYFQKALQNKISQLGAAHKDVAKLYQQMSEVHYLAENAKEGDAYKVKAEEILKK